jgi:DNA-binding NarL/FixJ family response regulator
MFRVFVVSPLPAVRAGLRALLGVAEDCQVVGEAENLAAANRQSTELFPDVVIADVGPDLDLGQSGVFDPDGPRPGLVVLGPAVADQRLPSELEGRAWAYVPQAAGGEQLVAAVRAVANGLVAIDPGLGGHLLGRTGVTVDHAVTAEGEELTDREHQVLQLVAQGLANKQIAARLSISEHTVKFHVAAVLAKLGAGSRTEAVHLGARRGLLAL